MNENILGCVYMIKCNINQKVYFGQSINFVRRKWEHISVLKKGTHKNHYLQEDYNNYGLNNFTFTILETNLDLQERRNREYYYINLYGGIESDMVYNYQDNVQENKEMRKLVSDNQKGKIISQVSIEKMRKSLTGRKLTDAHRLHIKEGCKRFCGDNNPAKRLEVRMKISEKVSGKGNGMYGKHHTPKAKNKIRLARLGKSPANKGKPIKDETRQKISDTLKRLYKDGKIKQNKKSKYNEDLILQLKNEYDNLKNYRLVQKLHPEICYDVVICLIKYGKTSKPYKKV